MKRIEGTILRISDLQIQDILKNAFLGMGDEIPKGLEDRFIFTVLDQIRKQARENELFWDRICFSTKGTWWTDFK